jgi:putative ABC transport system ATP-binding protein
MNEPVYRLREVEKIRTKGGASFTLRVPELLIHKGEFLSVVGPSGCGKSTLLDLLALVLNPTNSSCFTIDARNKITSERFDIPSLSENHAAWIRRKNIGYVLQSGGLFPFLTVRENIMLTAEISGKSIDSQAFGNLVDVLGLGDQLNKKPQYLSGGQRQRVAVARALIHQPSIILADEPTAAVDYPTALDIRDELKTLAHEVGSAVVMVTHDRSLVKDISDSEVRFEVVRKSLNDTLATTFVINKTAPGSSNEGAPEQGISK